MIQFHVGRWQIRMTAERQFCRPIGGSAYQVGNIGMVHHISRTHFRIGTGHRRWQIAMIAYYFASIIKFLHSWNVGMTADIISRRLVGNLQERHVAVLMNDVASIVTPWMSRYIAMRAIDLSDYFIPCWDKRLIIMVRNIWSGGSFAAWNGWFIAVIGVYFGLFSIRFRRKWQILMVSNYFPTIV